MAEQVSKVTSMNSIFSGVRQEEGMVQDDALNTRKNGPGDACCSNKKYCWYCYKDGHMIEECYRWPGKNVKPPSSYFRKNNFRPNFSGPNFSDRSESSNTWKSMIHREILELIPEDHLQMLVLMQSLYSLRHIRMLC